MRSYFGFQTVKKMYFCVNEKKSVNTKCPMNVYEFCRGGGGSEVSLIRVSIKPLRSGLEVLYFTVTSVMVYC